MRLLRLRLQSFRGVVDHEVALAPSGVTVVVGDNEVGKTSVVDALDLLLDEYDDSRKRAVRQTQPVGQDVPTVVEAEVRAGRYRFTYRKQWHRQPSTRLVVHEPAPEQVAGREAHARVLEILGQEVDLPLWRALRLQQGVGLEQAELDARSSLAQALDVGVAEQVGGEREETLVARVEAEHLRYFTPTGVPRQEARQLQAEVADAAARASGLEAAVAEVDRVVERLDRARDDAAAERAARARDAQALRAAEQHLGALEQVRRAAEVARGEAAGARARAATAEQHEAAREALVVRARELEDAAGDRRDAAAEAEEALGTALQRLEVAGEEAAGAADALARRRGERDAAAAARARRVEEREVARLRAVLVAHGRAEEAVGAAAARLAGHRVDDAALAAVEDAHRADVEAAARAGAAAPTVLLTGPGRRVVTADGEQHLGEEGLEVRLAGGTWVEVDGVRVSARPTGEQERAEAAAQRTGRALAERCAALGVADVAAAVAAAHARRSAATALEAAQEDARRVAAGEDLAEARRRVERWDAGAGDRGARADGDTEDQEVDPAPREPEQDGSAAEERLAAAEVALRAAVEGDARAAARREQAVAGVEAARRRAAEAVAAVKGADARAAVLAADLAAARGEADDASLAAARAAAADALVAADAALAAAEAAVASAGVEDAQAEVALRAQRLQDADGRLRRLEDEVGALAAVLEDRGGAGLVEQLAEARAEHDRLQREQVARDRRATAARTLHLALQEARSRAHEAYVQPLRAQLERLAAPVFGADVQVEVGADLRVASRTLGGTTVPFDQLSGGAREQLAVLGRLACAVLVSGGAGVPVLLDDALGYSDPERLDGMARALAAAGESCQVVVLTCVPERYRLVAGARTERLRG
ncbi:AAA family ATPase [uncultured Pseudokineococcus sp.]|uniref:AAA family ATPase n=1 Tax=uncultured Pseudokineococcus sp. TaxID=1642928 RepID=UPI002618BD5C|nr:AAA family ATPase [uncultured Pseudokineococcus sp.]